MISQDYAKILCATHCFINISPRGVKIASALGINTPTLYAMVDSPDWKKALQFWGYPDLNHKPVGYQQYKSNQRYGDLKRSYIRWKKLLKSYQPEPVTDIPVLSLEAK